RTCDTERTAKACGPGALVAGAKVADDDPRATVTQKPVSPGRARYRPLTPSRRECRCFGFIFGDYTPVLSTLAHGAAGAARHPAFPAPSSSFRGRVFCNDSGASASRECDGAPYTHLPRCELPREISCQAAISSVMQADSHSEK